MKNSIDLLPSSYHRTQLAQSRFRFWTLVLIIAMGVVGYDYHNECNAYHADLQILRAEQKKYAGVARQKRELSELKEQLTAKGEDVLSSHAPPSADYALSMLGIVSSSVRDCRGRLWIEELKMTSELPATANAKCRLSLKGKALDNLVVATFAATLRETGVFEHVELKPPNRQDADQRMRDYVVECLH